MYRIGIDTGGTCTDAVVYDQKTNKILSMAKAPTTHSCLEIGIGNAIDQLPREYLKESDLLSLSTTLATNACVENKGGRVKLIFIGANPAVVKRNYADYGFETTEFMHFVKGDPKSDETPDYDLLMKEVEKDLSLYDSVAVAQINPKDNDAAFEKEVKKRIRAISDKPIVCAYELFHDLNVIKRGASAYLNAKLLPIIAQFLTAIHKALEDRNLNLPIVIMRSDGSLMNEEYAAAHPVETLLCGPAASLKGGEFLLKRLSDDKNSVIIDMGGTTTDIALIRDGDPVLASKGIEIGDWQTFVKGLYVHTFGLGGDSEICYKENEISLSKQRVISVSAMAKEYPFILDKLQQLNEEYNWGHTRPIYSFVILQKKDYDAARYSKDECKICEALKDKPLTILELAEAVGKDLYTLNYSRLEAEGVIIRSGLTPTDMMCIKGHANIYDSAAAKLALTFFARSVHRTEDEIPDLVYELVTRKMYLNVVQVMLQEQFKNQSYYFDENIKAIAMDHYERMVSGQECDYFGVPMISHATLVGVGAPIHCFLPKVAKAMSAAYQVPKEAGVTNALGAIIGDIRVRESILIEAAIGAGEGDSATNGFKIYTPDGLVVFSEEQYEQAKALAIKIACEQASLRAREQGAKGSLSERVFEKKNLTKIYGSDMFVDAKITVEICGSIEG